MLSTAHLLTQQVLGVDKPLPPGLPALEKVNSFLLRPHLSEPGRGWLICAVPLLSFRG